MTTRSLSRPIIATIITPTNTPSVISGSRVEINSQQVLFNTNLLKINNQELGPGVTGTIAGFQISRGASSTPAQIVWNDADQAVEAGIVGALQRMAPVATSAASSDGYLKWSAAGARFEQNANAAYLNGMNQNVDTQASPSFQNLHLVSGVLTVANTAYQLPLTDGQMNYILQTDGSGNLVWAPPSSQIINGSGSTLVNITNDKIYMKAGGQNTVQIDSAKTQILNTLMVNGGAMLKTTTVLTNYNVLTGDSIIVYTGNQDATITLPDASTNAGRLLIIENTSLGVILSIATAIGDTFEGQMGPLLLDSQYSSMVCVSDGIHNWLLI